MPETELTINIGGSDRTSIRNALIQEFLKENPGNVESTSVYYYYVDRTSGGIDIYLKRPARLNKGMDFEVHANGIEFHNVARSGRVIRSSRPSHSTILTDLERKEAENPVEYARVRTFLTRIYNCENISNEELSGFNFTTGHSIEMILKIIKWLFIEQDITYWNWSGREMFYSGLNEI